MLKGTFHINDANIVWQGDVTAGSNPIIILHGLGDSSIHTYLPRFRRSILRDAPTLFVDLPGFGYSNADPGYAGTVEHYAADMHELIKHLDVIPRAIFGHSFGGNVALLLADRYLNPDVALVVAEPLLHADHSILARSIAKTSEEGFVTRGFDRLVRATSLQAHRGDVVAQAFLATVRMANPRIMHRAAVSLLADRSPDFHAILVSRHINTTLLIGSRTSVDTTELEHSGVSVIRIPDAGHNMIVEQPKATTAAIQRSLRL